MKSLKFFNLCLLVASLFFVSCNEDDDQSDVDCANFEWSYSEENTPDTWSTCNADCGGNAQSPIDITAAMANNGLSALNHDYKDVPVSITNNGHTLEFNYADGSEIAVDGVQYPLLQFHFHTDSEHTVNGVRFPMECHLVHKNESTGNIVVVSVLFEEGEENEFLANFSSNLPSVVDETFTSQDQVNIASLLPATAGYYNYTGSLTTPPCSEVVNWFVLQSTATASASQINNFASILNSNYRPAQDLNGRTISTFN